ncbi:hypothetical protein AFEL58S_01981 [Afipia felis]
MMDGLPGVLAVIAEVAGETAAIQLAAQYGGTRVYIPKEIPSDAHWLAECVGRRAADAICEHFRAGQGPGCRLDIPLFTSGAYPRLRRSIAKRIHDLHLANNSSREIAMRVGVAQRTVHRHRRAHRGENDDGQGSLL